MATENTYTVTVSDNVFHDWNRRLIDDLNEDVERCIIVKRTKTLCTLRLDKVALDGLINDLEYQIFVIQTNGDGESPAMLKRALAKLQAASPS